MDPQDVSASDLPDYVVPERDVEGNLRELKDLIHCAKQRRNIAAIRALCLSSRKVFISLEEEAWQYGANSATSRDHRQRAYAHLDDAESLFQELIDRFSASAHPRLKSFFSSIAARKADIAAIN